MSRKKKTRKRKKKTTKPLSFRQKLNKAIRDIYPSKHYSIEFHSGVIGGVRLHQYWDNGMWKWDADFQDWKGGLGFGRFKDGDNFCLQINRRYYESQRLWGWEAGNYLEGHLYVRIDKGEFYFE